MKVIVDTSVWSLALRRKKPVTDLVIAQFTRVITAGRVILPGVIRQEILSGIPDRQAYEKLRVKLTAFPDYPLNADDYEIAAEFFNTCRGHGIQGSNTDFLICAIANRHDCMILTTDKDFDMLSKHIPVPLFDSVES